MLNVEGGILFVHLAQLVVDPILKQRLVKNVVILKVWLMCAYNVYLSDSIIIFKKVSNQNF